MKPSIRPLLLVLLSLALAGAGCSSGGGTTASPTAVRGVITGLGSVIVNGIEFDTTSAGMVADDIPCTQGSFGVGMVVTVTGTIDASGRTGTASSVVFYDDLQGPAASIDAALGTFLIYGLPVRVDANTKYEGIASLSGLAAGDIVEVSGLPDPGAAQIRATHVELKGATDSTETKGYVIGVPAAGSLVLSPFPGGVPSIAVQFAGTLPAGIGSGSFVEVKVGSYDSVTRTITATEIEMETEFSPSNDRDVSIEGYVAGYDATAKTFFLGATKVDASQMAAMGPMVDGIRVEAEGLMVNGVLVARRIQYHTASQGVITSFGSVWVNGIEYDTTNAVITVEGRPATQGSLGVGMVVEVSGVSSASAGMGEAQELRYKDDLQGWVGTVDRVANTLTVMGVTVKADPTTVFSDVAGLAGIVAGDVVEVSGHADPAGFLLATRIELQAAGDAKEIKGVVSAWTPGTSTFNLTATDGSTLLTVDYSAMAGSLPTGFADGSYVEVEASGFTPPASLAASKVSLEDSPAASDGEHAEIQGLVSALDPVAKTFTIEGVPVNAMAVSSTLPAGFASGFEVEVEGFMVGGVLMATEVNVEQESLIDLEGDVASIDLAAGTIGLLGQVVKISAATIMLDSSAAAVSPFALANLAVGDHVEAAGYLDADAVTVVGTKVERIAPPAAARATLQGTMSAVAGTPAFTLTVLGQVIATGPSTIYRDSTDATVSRDAFFAALVAGTTVVEAEWEPFGLLTDPATKLKVVIP